MSDEHKDYCNCKQCQAARIASEPAAPTGSEVASQRIENLRETLVFIAGQGCESKGEYASCKDLPSNPCVTEFCLPCYAAAALESDDVLADWQKRREGLKDHEA